VFSTDSHDYRYKNYSQHMGRAKDPYSMRCDNLFPEAARVCCWGADLGKLLYPSLSGHVPA
jgi:hypothetical protein